MLKLYDHLDAILEQQRKRDMKAFYFQYWVSDLRDELEYDDEKSLHEALQRSFEICCRTGIPIEENFRRVYRFTDTEMKEDWQLSDLACYLLIINGASNNPYVARAQLRAAVAFKKRRL
jgi:hypothetical protein